MALSITATPKSPLHAELARGLSLTAGLMRNGEALTKMQVGNWYQYFLAQLLGTQGFTQLTAGLVAPYLLGAPAQPALGTQGKPRVQITPQAFCSSPPLHHAALGK